MRDIVFERAYRNLVSAMKRRRSDEDDAASAEAPKLDDPSAPAQAAAKHVRDRTTVSRSKVGRHTRKADVLSIHRGEPLRALEHRGEKAGAKRGGLVAAAGTGSHKPASSVFSFFKAAGAAVAVQPSASSSSSSSSPAGSGIDLALDKGPAFGSVDEFYYSVVYVLANVQIRTSASKGQALLGMLESRGVDFGTARVGAAPGDSSNGARAASGADGDDDRGGGEEGAGSGRDGDGDHGAHVQHYGDLRRGRGDLGWGHPEQRATYVGCVFNSGGAGGGLRKRLANHRQFLEFQDADVVAILKLYEIDEINSRRGHVKKNLEDTEARVRAEVGYAGSWSDVQRAVQGILNSEHLWAAHSHSTKEFGGMSGFLSSKNLVKHM